jgi:hypothetical protein
VNLVDVSKTPIECFTALGIEVKGIEYPLDAVVCAVRVIHFPELENKQDVSVSLSETQFG